MDNVTCNCIWKMVICRKSTNIVLNKLKHTSKQHRTKNKSDSKISEKNYKKKTDKLNCTKLSDFILYHWINLFFILQEKQFKPNCFIFWIAWAIQIHISSIFTFFSSLSYLFCMTFYKWCKLKPNRFKSNRIHPWTCASIRYFFCFKHNLNVHLFVWMLGCYPVLEMESVQWTGTASVEMSNLIEVLDLAFGCYPNVI